MLISFSWYSCNNWYEEEIIKYEIEGYGFKHHTLKTHYDPNGVVDKYCKKLHTSYKYHSLGNIKIYQNI